MTYPTAHPDINDTLHVLLSGARAVLGKRFVGLYLYGSLASGDFDPQRSDVDFVVVTADALPDEVVTALEALHARIAASGSKWAAKLEGAYVPQRLIRRHDPAGPPCPTINEGHFYLAPLGSDWVIQRHVIREQGVVVAGPSPRTLIDPVRPDDLQHAVLGFLREWWAPMLQKPDPRLDSGEYQAYTVLTMCRALYTLHCGKIVSKPVAARWARGALDERWAALIEWALTWQPGTQPDHKSETLDFIRYTLNTAAQARPTINRMRAKVTRGAGFLACQQPGKVAPTCGFCHNACEFYLNAINRQAKRTKGGKPP